MSYAFDGGNFLVGVENHLTIPTTIAAQMISTNGTKVGYSNVVVVVDACTNLIHSLWSPVGINTLSGGSAYFSDSGWTNDRGRFYRLRSP